MALYRVTLSGLIHSNVFNNVLHIQRDAVEPNQDSLIADIIDNHWITNILPRAHNQTRYTNINVRNVSTPGNATFNKPISRLGTSSAANATDQPTLCIYLRFLTAVAGRTGHGGLHMVGVSINNDQNLGVLIQGAVDAWNVRLNLIKAALLQGGSQGVALMLCNRTNPVASSKSVTNLAVRAVLGTMRSRNYNVGI